MVTKLVVNWFQWPQQIYPVLLSSRIKEIFYFFQNHTNFGKKIRLLSVSFSCWLIRSRREIIYMNVCFLSNRMIFLYVSIRIPTKKKKKIQFFDIKVKQIHEINTDWCLFHIIDGRIWASNPDECGPKQKGKESTTITN